MLTKSDLQSFLQCPKKLWLEKNNPAVGSTADPANRRRMLNGNAVGEKARLELGENMLWPIFQGTPEQVADQAKIALFSSPNVPVAEFPMTFGTVYARADALLPDGGKYILRETKASSFPLKSDKSSPGKPDNHHVVDVAIQAWVMEQSGIPMSRAELNLLDNQWRYPGNGDYRGLFRQLDVTEDVRSYSKNVALWADQAAATVIDGMPTDQTGKHCHQPIDCQFYDYCKKLDPPSVDHPIELLPNSSGKKLAKNLKETRGYQSILEPAAEELTGSQSVLYRRIQAAHRDGKAILEPGSTQIMAAFKYPRYYFDFEGIDFPVPEWPGTRPYEQITFQWSCHIETSPGKFEHREFLDLTGGDPSLPCIEAMLETINLSDGGPIFVYYAPYERGRIEELAERHPEHSVALNMLITRLVDLLPIVRDHFYHPAMIGSFSIKKVLPVIAPDLDYAKLQDVHDGTGAQLAYLEAIAPNPHSPDEHMSCKWVRIDSDISIRSLCRWIEDNHGAPSG